jgi:hypothetical protein
MLAACLLIGLHTWLLLGTFRDYGMSWDQPSSHGYGEAVVRFYTTLGSDKTAQTHWLHPYGGLFEIAAGIVERVTGFGWFEARTLATGLFGLIGVFAILRTGWVIYGPQVGVTAAALLLLTPTYYGHQFINPKDLPFAALSMLSLRYISELAWQFPSLRWATVLKAGVAIGMAMGVRVGGLQLFGVIAIGLVFAVCRARHSPLLKNTRTWSLWLVQATVLFLIAWTVMVAAWPFAMTAPISGPFLALKEFSRFWWDGNVFYDGRLLKTSDLPFTYIPNLLARTLPDVVLLALIGGAFSIGWSWFRTPTQRDSCLFAPTAAIVGAVALPLAAIWVMQARVYDGLRHVLFIFPPLVLLSAIGISALSRRLLPAGRSTLWFAAGALAGVTVADLRALHPYQYIYFNRLVGGGVPVANQSYDLDYWATGLREAAEWVVQYYIPASGQTVVYSASAEPEQVEMFLHSKQDSSAKFRRAAPGEKARIFLLIRRNRQQQEMTWGRTLHTVSRQGVPLVDIVEAQ